MSTIQSRRVVIKVRSVGQAFGCIAELRDEETDQKLAETDRVRPHGMRGAAYSDGEALAADRGWEVAS